MFYKIRYYYTFVNKCLEIEPSKLPISFPLGLELTASSLYSKVWGSTLDWTLFFSVYIQLKMCNFFKSICFSAQQVSAQRLSA